jgi:hypothetical protein
VRVGGPTEELSSILAAEAAKREAVRRSASVGATVVAQADGGNGIAAGQRGEPEHAGS